ncbi:MAG: hypothetical protein HY094_04020 [Candidatus Melainabacteria bacterium]|nr:hypothetical protein [Candidatus Melainabacteria bacterium]
MRVQSSSSLGRKPETRRFRQYLRELKTDLIKSEVNPDEYVLKPAEIVSSLGCEINYSTAYRIAHDEGFKITSVHEARETPASIRVKEYIKNLKTELTKKGIPSSEYTIYPTDIANTLSDENIHVVPETVSAIARSCDFKIASMSDIKSTKASQIVKKYFDDLEEKLKKENIQLSNHTVYPERLSKELSTDSVTVRRLTVRREARKRGFQIATNTDSQLVSHETPASKLVREHFDNSNPLKEPGTTVYPTELASDLSTEQIPVERQIVSREAKRRKIKVASLSEAETKAHETPSSKLVRKYFDDLLKQLTECGIEPSELTIYPTEMGRELSNATPVNSETIRYVAKGHGFRLATKSQGRLATFQSRQGVKDLLIANPLLALKEGENIERLKEEEPDANLNRLNRILDGIAKSNPFTYDVLSLHFGFKNDKPMSYKEIGKILKISTDEVSETISRSLKYFSEVLK